MAFYEGDGEIKIILQNTQTRCIIKDRFGSHKALRNRRGNAGAAFLWMYYTLDVLQWLRNSHLGEIADPLKVAWLSDRQSQIAEQTPSGSFARAIENELQVKPVETLM